MCLKGHRLGADLLVDELGELFHDVSLDFVEKSVEVATISVSEPLGVAGDLLGKCFGLLEEVASELLQAAVEIGHLEAEHSNINYNSSHGRPRKDPGGT